MKQIAIVLGTRPEAIKLIPVYLAFKNNLDFNPVIISTGQHKEMLEHIFRFFEIMPQKELGVMTPGQTLSSLTARLIESIDKDFQQHKFDLVMVQGDTTTAFAAALVAYYHKIPVAHIEAGLRTHDIYAPFPEEVNRSLIAPIARMNFAPTLLAADALKKENREHTFIVGNTVIDSLLLCSKKIEQQKSFYQNLFADIVDKARKLILITGHRRESFGNGFKNICEAISSLAKLYPDFIFVYPVHLNPNVQEVVYETLNNEVNIKLIDPLPYDQLVFLMSQAYIILTDSGGIQEEAPYFNVPVIVMRDKTEREEGVQAGCAVLAGTTVSGITEAFKNIVENKQVYDTMAQVKNPYGDGTASDRIVAIAKEFLCNT